MPTDYSFNFYMIDPGNPPERGSIVNPVTLTARDHNDSGSIDAAQGDTIGGFTVTSVSVGDTVTVFSGGPVTTITGVTFYRDGAEAVFMPTDGTVLPEAKFRSSTEGHGLSQFSLPPVPCFVAGTMIFTAEGAKAVETLVPGDLLLTRDSGMQPIRWVGQVTVDGTGRFAPICFMPETVGNTAILMVSPNHRMLMTGWRAEIYFGEREILVPAKTVNGGDKTGHVAAQK